MSFIIELSYHPKFLWGYNIVRIFDGEGFFVADGAHYVCWQDAWSAIALDLWAEETTVSSNHPNKFWESWM